MLIPSQTALLDNEVEICWLADVGELSYLREGILVDAETLPWDTVAYARMQGDSGEATADQPRRAWFAGIDWPPAPGAVVVESVVEGVATVALVDAGDEAARQRWLVDVSTRRFAEHATAGRGDQAAEWAAAALNPSVRVSRQ